MKLARKPRAPARMALSCLILSAICIQVQHAEAKSDIKPSFAELDFANRARCATLSELPTRSVLIIGDGFDAGRLAFNIRKSSSIAISEAEAMSQFRRSVGFTMSLVADRLLKRSLPYISNESDDRIAELWQSSARTNYASGHAAGHSGEQRPNYTTCIKVDRFGALQSHLNRPKPDLATLSEIGRTLSEKNKSNDCTSPDKTGSSQDRHFVLQLDLPTVPEDFDKTGFQFWASLKAYSSWAWRNAPEVRQISGRFGDLFPSLALEDEVMITPNGCRSTTMPKCDLQRLALDAVRELAKPAKTESGFESQFPDGPQSNLIKRGARNVSDGFLGTNSSDADQWAKNFTQRFTEARWVNRNKLQNAKRVASLLKQLRDIELFSKDLETDLKRFPLLDTKDFSSQMASICVETKILAEPEFRLLRPQFDAIQAAVEATQSESPEAQAIAAAVKSNASRIGTLCKALEKTHFRNDNLNYGYLSDWARERLMNFASDAPLPQEVRRKGWNRPEPYLTLTKGQIPLCQSPAACVQMLYRTYVDLHYVSTWGSALGKTNRFKDPNLFNPYAELNACKIYDPWFTKSAANSLLAQRLVVSALSAAIPLPIFAESAEKRPKVSGFSAKITNQTVGFEPEFDNQSNRTTFFADLGPIAGAPCAIQYSNDTGTPFQVYGVGGVTLNYCSDQKGGSTDLDSSSNGSGRTSDGITRRSICGGCTINLASAAATASYAAPAGPWRALFGSVRAFGLYIDSLKDEKNIPVSYTVRPNYVRDTFVENRGSIPQWCEQSLINGYRCHSDVCAAHAAHIFENQTGLRARESSIGYEGESHPSIEQGTRNGLVGIRVEECDGEINARVSCDFSNREFKVQSEFSSFSRSCRRAIEQFSKLGGNK